MSGVLRGVFGVGLLLSSTVARAQAAPTKADAPKADAPKADAPKADAPKADAPKSRRDKFAKTAKPPAAAQSGGAGAPAAPSPSASASPSAPPTKKEDHPAPPNEAAPDSDSSENPAAAAAAPDRSSPPTPAPPSAPATVRVFMRSGRAPLVFSARASNDDGTPTSCSAPCAAQLLPGEYRLRLNGIGVERPVKLVQPGTLEGKLVSREASREAGWLALNVGGILGGVFVTIAALGGPSWTYAAGGGSLLGGGVIFALTYHADGASVSFSASEPTDVRGMPPPAPRENRSVEPPPSTGAERLRGAPQARGLGLRIDF